jgi:hypothetical protein
MAKVQVSLPAKDVEKWTRLARSDQPAFRTLSPARQFRSSARTFDLGRQHARSCRAGGISQGLTSCAEGLGRGCNLDGIVFSANFPTEWSRRRSPASYVDRIASRLAHFFTTVGPDFLVVPSHYHKSIGFPRFPRAYPASMWRTLLAVLAARQLASTPYE